MVRVVGRWSRVCWIQGAKSAVYQQLCLSARQRNGECKIEYVLNDFMLLTVS